MLIESLRTGAMAMVMVSSAGGGRMHHTSHFSQDGVSFLRLMPSVLSSA
jgi:hypothetical protein